MKILNSLFQASNISQIVPIWVVSILLQGLSPHPAAAAIGATLVPLEADHVPPQVARAADVGPVVANSEIRLTMALNLRNQSVLQDLINRIYDEKDPLYHHFLTPQTFAKQFGPAPEDVATIQNYISSLGFTVTKTTTNTIQFKGAAAAVEKAFGVELHQYRTSDGSVAFAPSGNPKLDASIAPKVLGVLGLNSFSRLVAHRIRRPANPTLSAFSSSPSAGSGPDGGLSPSDIKTAYSFNGGSQNGAGQTLGLMELDGYTASDITAYTKNFSLGAGPALQNILVDGYNGSAGSGADEVTLDIELMMAVAPGASKILVYEGVNNENGPLDVYTKIADDNLAKQVSSSWGSPESGNTSAFLNSENTVFEQMAAQGQSMYAASGDDGAYDDGTTLSVDDPGSQPYVTATGGTTLTVGSGGAYQSESSWGISGSNQQGGGGGISSVWSLPSFQTGLGTAANEGSTTMRMVPDVSIDANPSTGYAIYVGGEWAVFGGTSCAAPIWAALTALVNQARANSGESSLGYANPAIYKAASTSYATTFHDIKDNSTNLYYPAVTGYDLSTGLGSPIAGALLSALAGATLTSEPPPAPTPAPSNPPAAPTNLTVISVIVD